MNTTYGEQKTFQPTLDADSMINRESFNFD